MKFNNIETALNWIMGQRRNGAEFTRFKETMKILGNPQDDFKMIHVAGTNGKGSTVAYLRDALMTLGYKVGTLQSPHYQTHLDRIRINNQNIKAEAFLDILNRYYDFFIEHDCNMFEMDYIIMCEYFKEEAVDLVIVEVGMGGRLDSTNVIKQPLLSIITTIGLDHIKELGNTKVAIAKEKAGIIKDDSKVLVGHLDDDVKACIKEIAEVHHAKFYELGKIEDLGNRHFRYKQHDYQLLSYAKYQLHNASLALEALDVLGIRYDYDAVYKAFAKTNWQGRFEVINESPLVIIDGAHNEDGIKALKESLADIKMPKAILFSAIKTKEYDKMIDLLVSASDELVITKFHHPLNIDAKDLASRHHLKEVDDFMEAFEYLKAKYPCIVVCGSLYFLSEFMENYKR